jgi:hypothetical protein
MEYAILIGGLVLMAVGVCIKPKDAGVEWSSWWGLSANSTAAGKGVYMVGAILFLYQIFTWVQGLQ